MVFFRSSLGKSRFNGILLITLLFCSLTVIFSPSALAEPWNAPAQGSFLQPKWVGYVAGGGEAIVTADVNARIFQAKKCFMLEVHLNPLKQLAE